MSMSIVTRSLSQVSLNIDCVMWWQWVMFHALYPRLV